ncbi:MAG: 30S ribosomal protein S16 [Candidatus Hydrogenedentales bacterium]
MATVIRMKRGGRTHAPYYRVVVMDGRNRPTGRVIEEIGIYHPCARPEPRAEIDAKRALQWLWNGAQPSDTVRSILTRQGVMEMFAKGTKPEELSDASPAEAPSAEAPSAEAPPAETPPAETPPAEAPPAEAPSAEAPSAEAPPAEAPSAEAPSAEAPSVETAPAETPAESPSTEASPADTASAEAEETAPDA